MIEKNEYSEIIATLDRIIAMQDRMIEKLNGVNNTMNELNEYISSKQTTDEDYLSSVMYGVDNEQ